MNFRQYGYGLLLDAVQTVVDAGELEVSDVEGFAVMVNGALDHLAAWIAKTDTSNRLKIAKVLAEQFLTLHRKS